jgi:hypothetical protein
MSVPADPWRTLMVATAIVVALGVVFALLWQTLRQLRSRRLAPQREVDRKVRLCLEASKLWPGALVFTSENSAWIQDERGITIARAHGPDALNMLEAGVAARLAVKRNLR